MERRRGHPLMVHVRFGSKADICGAKRHVRFTPESDTKRDMMECQLWANSRHRTIGSSHSRPGPATLQASLSGVCGCWVILDVPCRDLHDMDRIASMASSFDHRGFSKTDDGARKIPDTSCCGTESSGPRVRIRQARAPART